MHIEWGINEKVSLEIAYTAGICGLRSAVAMKQVGLNVASDPFMSTAYQGVKGMDSSSSAPTTPVPTPPRPNRTAA